MSRDSGGAGSIHWQTLNGTLPITGYQMDGNRGQVMLPGTGRERLIAENIEVLPSVKPVIPVEPDPSRSTTRRWRCWTLLDAAP